MNYLKRLLLVAVSTIFLIPLNIYAEKYAGEIFRLHCGIRNTAMGATGLTDYNTPAPAYWNSALLNQNPKNQIEVMHSEEFNGLLQYDIVSGIFGNKRKYAVSLCRIGINDVPLTKKSNPGEPLSNDNRPKRYKSITNADYILYIGFNRAIKLKNKVFNLGFTPKIAYRNLAEESGYGFGADLSGIYSFNSKIDFAFKVRDFFSTQVFWQNGTHETVNPGLDLETAYTFILPFTKRNVVTRLGAECYTESRDKSATTSMGFFSMDYHAGLEVVVNDYLNVLAGYDVENFTAGLGVNLNKLNINYSFEQNPELDNSHRISIGYFFE